MPAQWAVLTVENQRDDAGSTLALYRRAIELRSARAEFNGDAIEWLPAAGDALIFRRGGLRCALNAGERPLPLPDGELLLASAQVTDGVLPPNAAAWLV